MDVDCTTRLVGGITITLYPTNNMYTLSMTVCLYACMFIGATFSLQDLFHVRWMVAQSQCIAFVLETR